MRYTIGVVGLGVMGANLARNMESRGIAVAGYDLDPAKTQAFAAGEGRTVIGATGIIDACAAFSIHLLICITSNGS